MIRANRTMLVAILLFLFGSISATASDWRRSPEISQLYKRAVKEGEVSIWGTAPQEVNWLPAALQEEFPELKVKVIGDTNIATRAIAEARAGRHDVDVFWCALGATVSVVERGLLVRVEWSHFGVDATATAFDGKFAFTNNVLYTVAYDARADISIQKPRTWRELLEEEYRDTMAASPFLAAGLISALGTSWGEDNALRYARDLRNNTGILLTNAPLEQLLMTGERKYAIAVLDQSARQWLRSGARVNYVIPEPAVAVQFGAAVMAKAPHPNAARLVAGWLASPRGRRARELATFATDYRPGSKSQAAVELYRRNIDIVHDTPEQTRNRTEINRKVREVFAGNP